MVLSSIFTWEQTILLPHRLTRETMQSLITKVVDDQGEPRFSRVRFDSSRLEFIDPTGVVVLANLVDYLRRVGARVRVRVTKPYSESIEYLDDFGFFKHYGGASLRPHAAIRNTTVPLARVASDRIFEYLDHQLMPW